MFSPIHGFIIQILVYGHKIQKREEGSEGQKCNLQVSKNICTRPRKELKHCNLSLTVTLSLYGT